MCKKNSLHKIEASVGCVREIPQIKMKPCVSSGSVSLFLSLCLAICLFLFCKAFFFKAVFDANFGFSCFVFLSLWGFLSLLSAFLHLLLFNVVLLFFMFLVASFSSGCFFFLFSVGRHRAPFSLLCATFSSFVCFVFAGPCSTQLFPYWFCSHQFAELGSIQCLAFSPRACSLAFLSFAILFLAICRAFFILFIFYYCLCWFVFLWLVLSPFSL